MLSSRKVGDELLKPCTCTVFVPGEGGKRLVSKKILGRLQISNRGLYTDL